MRWRRLSGPFSFNHVSFSVLLLSENSPKALKQNSPVRGLRIRSGGHAPGTKAVQNPIRFFAEGGSGRVIKLLYLNHDIGYPSPALAKAGDGAVHGGIKLVA